MSPAFPAFTMATYEHGGEAHFRSIDAEIRTGRWIAAWRREFPGQTDALSFIPENGLPFSCCRI
jgi:hypothetical protein